MKILSLLTFAAGCMARSVTASLTTEKMKRKIIFALFALLLLWFGRDGARGDELPVPPATAQQRIAPSADQLKAYQDALKLVENTKLAVSQAEAILKFSIQQMQQTCEKHKLVLMQEGERVVCGEPPKETDAK